MLTSIPTASAFASILLFASFVSAVNLECEHVRVEGKKFDLSKLGGPHSILVQDTEAHPAKSNTTWTIDICKQLTKPKGSKGTPKEDWCPNYTRGMHRHEIDNNTCDTDIVVSSLRRNKILEPL